MTPTLRFVFCSWLLAGALGTATASPKAAAETSPAIAHEAKSAVVKVFSTMRRPDVARPWSKAAPIEATGSGVVIEGKRILTNAHVIAYASQVEVQGNQSRDKISATVEAVDPGIDLAVLKLEDESFFDKRPPLPLEGDQGGPVVVALRPPHQWQLAVQEQLVVVAAAAEVERLGHHERREALQTILDVEGA